MKDLRAKTRPSVFGSIVERSDAHLEALVSAAADVLGHAGMPFTTHGAHDVAPLPTELARREWRAMASDSTEMQAVVFSIFISQNNNGTFALNSHIRAVLDAPANGIAIENVGAGSLPAIDGLTPFGVEEQAKVAAGFDYEPFLNKAARIVMGGIAPPARRGSNGSKVFDEFVRRHGQTLNRVIDAAAAQAREHGFKVPVDGVHKAVNYALLPQARDRHDGAMASWGFSVLSDKHELRAFVCFIAKAKENDGFSFVCEAWTPAARETGRNGKEILMRSTTSKPAAAAAMVDNANFAVLFDRLARGWRAGRWQPEPPEIAVPDGTPRSYPER